jgi:hypothetical protein
MTIIYVAEVNGAGVGVFDAANIEGAEEVLKDPSLITDLVALAPDFDENPKIGLRKATPDERMEWELQRADALHEGWLKENERFLGYLVPPLTRVLKSREI